MNTANPAADVSGNAWGAAWDATRSERSVGLTDLEKEAEALADEIFSLCDGKPAAEVMLALMIVAAHGMLHERAEHATIRQCLDAHLQGIMLRCVEGMVDEQQERPKRDD